MAKEIWVNARFLTQPKSGVQIFAIEICKKLAKINPQINFVAPSNIRDKKLVKELNIVNTGNKTGALWEQIDLPKFLKKKNSPLLLNLCNTAPLNYTNNIITIHDLAFIENPNWFSTKFKIWYKFLIPKIALKAKHIITVSEFSKNEISDNLAIPKKKISVIYNGLQTDIIKFKKENSLAIKKEKIIICVGSFNPRKNLTPLIKAFEKLNLNDYKLLIVGAKNENFNSQKPITSHKNIEYLGYLPNFELFKLYQKAQLLIYPSLYEGFGIPILEAIYFGCPVLVSNLAVYKEIYHAFGLNYIKGEHEIYYMKELNNILTLKKDTIYSSNDIEQQFDYKKNASQLHQLIIEFIN